MAKVSWNCIVLPIPPRSQSKTLLGKAMLFMLFGNGAGKVVQGFEVLLYGKSLAEHGSQHLRLEVRNHSRELFYGLAAPAIGANNGDKLEPGSQSIG